MQVFQPEQLERYLRCPLAPGFKDDRFEQTMISEVTSLFRKAGDKVYTLSYLRDLLCKAWEAQDHTVNGKSSLERTAGHKAIPAIASRIGRVLRDYQIIMPLTTIRLVVTPALYSPWVRNRSIPGDGVNREILVDYAVARPWRKDVPWLCVNLRRSRPPQFWKYPDYVGLTRWLHIQQREQMKTFEILHVPILNGKSWIESDLSLPLVHGQVITILDAIEREQQFAQPGAYCENCTLPRCLEKVHGI